MCEKEEYAKRYLDSYIAESLKDRLADLEAAATVQDLIAGYPRRCKTSEKYRVNLSDGFCVEFSPNHIKNPISQDGNVDWNRVSRIQILSIGKCND